MLTFLGLSWETWQHFTHVPVADTTTHQHIQITDTSDWAPLEQLSQLLSFNKVPTDQHSASELISIN